MPKSRSPYPAEFRQQMVELVRSGHSPGALAKEFEPSAQTIHTWVKQADLDSGQRPDGLTTTERAEVRRLRRQIKQLRTERDILAKAGGPGSLGRPIRSPRSLRIREGVSGPLSSDHAVPCVGCLLQRLLRVAEATALGP